MYCFRVALHSLGKHFKLKIKEYSYTFNFSGKINTSFDKNLIYDINSSLMAQNSKVEVPKLLQKKLYKKLITIIEQQNKLIFYLSFPKLFYTKYNK